MPITRRDKKPPDAEVFRDIRHRKEEGGHLGKVIEYLRRRVTKVGE